MKSQFKTARTLVRYVDEDRAVIDTMFILANTQWIGSQPIEVHFRLTGPKGRQFTYQSHIELTDCAGMMRVEIECPRRWWPAGMGNQNLYELCLTLLVGDESVDSWKSILGMTSVRPSEESEDVLLVNGHDYAFDSIVTIGRNDEDSVLPVTGDTLLLVRDHYGPNVLYDAADRAGILLIQAVPLTRESVRSVVVRREVDRLASHPSLAGWMVDHIGRIADRVVERIHHLDPTRRVFRQQPGAC